MYIRRKTLRDTTYYQVVEHRRTDGKDRQVVVLSLGTCATIAEAREHALTGLATAEAEIVREGERGGSTPRRAAQRAEARAERIRKFLVDLDAVEKAMAGKPEPAQPNPAEGGGFATDRVAGEHSRRGQDAADPYPWAGSFLYRDDPKYDWGIWLVAERSPAGIRYHELGADLCDVLSAWWEHGTDPSRDASRRASKVRAMDAETSALLCSGGTWEDEDGSQWHGFDETVRAELDRLLKGFAEEDETDREWEEHKRQRAEARKVAPWPEPEKYIYWRQGDRWRAHRIQKEDEGYITFSPFGCRLREIGTPADPNVRLRGVVAFGLLHAVLAVNFNADYSHDMAEQGTLFLNCDAVRDAYAKDKDKDHDGRTWEDAEAWYEDLRSKFRDVFGHPPDLAAHYATLGLEAGATLAEVKAAYRVKAKATHPDRGGSPEQFRRVQEAYDAIEKVLGKPAA